jgi:hypothetical protein
MAIYGMSDLLSAGLISSQLMLYSFDDSERVILQSRDCVHDASTPQGSGLPESHARRVP